jgi:hypothetical protein
VRAVSAVGREYAVDALASSLHGFFGVESRGTSRSRSQAPPERLRDSRHVRRRVPYDGTRLRVVGVDVGVR